MATATPTLVVNGPIVKHVGGNTFICRYDDFIEWTKLETEQSFMPVHIKLVSDRTGDKRTFEYHGIDYIRSKMHYLYGCDDMRLEIILNSRVA